MPEFLTKESTAGKKEADQTKAVQEVIPIKQKVSNERRMKYEMKEGLALVLPGYLLSLMSRLLGAVEAQLHEDSSDSGRAYTALDHDNTPLKRALDMLRVGQQGLAERLHGMSPEEQLAQAYFIYGLSKSLMEHRGSLEQLQTSHEVESLAGFLLSIGGSPQEHDSDQTLSYDVFFLVISALSSVIYNDGVVLVQHPIVMEAFTIIDARSSDYLPMYGQSLIVAPLIDSFSKESNVAVIEGFNSSQVSDVKGEGQHIFFDSDLPYEIFDEIIEGLYSSEDSTPSLSGDMKEGFTKQIKYIHDLVETLGFKMLLRDVKDSYKKKSLQCGVVGTDESIIANEGSLDVLSVSDHANTCNTIPEVPLRKKDPPTDPVKHHLHDKVWDKNLLPVEHNPEHVEFVLHEKTTSPPKQSVSCSIDNVDLVVSVVHLDELDSPEVIANHSQCLPPPPDPHSVDLQSIGFSGKIPVVHLDELDSFDTQDHSQCLPPPPNPTPSWCWKRRIKPLCVANMQHYISKASRRALEECDKECNETICHAIVAVLDPKPAVTLVRALKSKSLDVFSHYDKHGNTPLHNAVMTGNVALVQEILGHLPAALHIQNNDYATPIDVAMHLKHHQIVEYLVHQAIECDPHSTESIELLQSYLLKAMKIGYIEYLRILLELHNNLSLTVDFECTDSDQHTAWHYLKQKESHVQNNAIEILKTSHLGCVLISLIVGRSQSQIAVDSSTQMDSDSVTVVTEPNPDNAIPPSTNEPLEPVCSKELHSIEKLNSEVYEPMFDSLSHPELEGSSTHQHFTQTDQTFT